MTPSDLARYVNATGSLFFTRPNMRFSGDSMSNYGVAGPVTIVERDGSQVECWELYRKRAVNGGLTNSAYFDIWEFKQRYPQSASPKDRLWEISVPSFEYKGHVTKWGNKMFHWIITLKCGRRSYAVDYYAGLGHVEADKLTPRKPTLTEVLSSLQLDCSAATPTLAEFVSEFGDSAAASKTWKACHKVRTSMLGLLGSYFRSFVSESLEA